MRNILIALLLALFAAPALAAEGDLTTDRGLVYRAWLPRDFAGHHHDVPLILFSHGFGGCAQQSSDLTQALADAGYAVLAPDHKDEGCGRYKLGMLGIAIGMVAGPHPDMSFGDDDKWTPQTEIGRHDDIEALLDFALRTAPYRDAIDPNRIGALGHSLGGYTVLGLAGGWPSLRDPRIGAVAALAPFSNPYLDHQTLGAIQVPTLYGGGSDDQLISARTVRNSYDMATSRRYLLLLQGAGHFAWTQLEPEYQATIARYCIAFFDHELMHRPAPLLDQPAGGQMADYRHTP